MPTTNAITTEAQAASNAAAKPVRPKKRRGRVLEAYSPTRQSRVSNGRQLFLNGDQRSREARRFRDIVAAIVGDLGGLERLSEGQKQLARRCALLSVECEIIEQAAVAGGEIDLEAYGIMTDRIGRAFQRLGLKRVPKDVPSLVEHLASLADAQDDGDENEGDGDGDGDNDARQLEAEA